MLNPKNQESEPAVTAPLLDVKDLKKHFPVETGFFNRQKGILRAVDGISFQLHEREILGVVGESGCGKSTAGRSLLRLIEPTSGEITFEGTDILKLQLHEMRRFRRQMQFIFQDPFSSLNPRMTIGKIIAEPLVIHKLARGTELDDRVAEIMKKVGLRPEFVSRYPHEFSGGQRQRIGIARSLIVNPRLIIADEPVSALDVSIQAQVINLLEDLQDEFQMSYLVISHDMSVIYHICDRIAVMYLGQIVELAGSDDLVTQPLHPYTEALLSAVPIADTTVRERKARIVLKGDVPSPVNPPTGCRFHTRCRYARERCSVEAPALREVAPGHLAACHYSEEVFG